MVQDANVRWKDREILQRKVDFFRGSATRGRVFAGVCRVRSETDIADVEGKIICAMMMLARAGKLVVGEIRGCGEVLQFRVFVATEF